jgi:type II secretory pathway component PulF
VEGVTVDEQSPVSVEPCDAPASEFDRRRFRVVAIVAGILFAPQVIAHIAITFAAIPTFKQMYSDFGGPLPWTTAFVLSLGPFLGLVLVALDGFAFWLFYRLAKKYWIGLLFAPLFTGGLITGPLIAALYLPMFQIITLVK